MEAETPREEQLREQPLPELIRNLADQTTTLVRQEIELAKAEVTEKGKEAGQGVGLLVAAGVAALLALGAMSAFLIMLLDGVLPNWLASLIVTLLWAAIGAVLALQGRNRLKQVPPVAPEQTIDTVKEDVQWAKTRASSARK